MLRFLIEEDFDYDNEELNLNPSGVQIERKSFKQMFPETKSMTSLEHLKQMDTEDMTLLLLPGLE